MAQANRRNNKLKFHKPHLVQATAEKMRDLIFAHEPNTQIGSLNEMARLLGVGIVTVQQAARILEHEGLLQVRRGPGGGYYGMRPDEEALERSIAAYVRVHGSGYLEVTETMSLLDCELISAAARCTDDTLCEALRGLSARIDQNDTMQARLAFEQDLHQVLIKMVDQPIIKLLARVTMRLYKTHPIPALFSGEQGVADWKADRHRIVQAILKHDEELARFEATRHRQDLLKRLRGLRGVGQAEAVSQHNP
jgi:DNA-binding FadR family transcriptional regulator